MIKKEYFFPSLNIFSLTFPLRYSDRVHADYTLSQTEV